MISQASEHMDLFSAEGIAAASVIIGIVLACVVASVAELLEARRQRQRWFDWPPSNGEG